MSIYENPRFGRGNILEITNISHISEKQADYTLIMPETANNCPIAISFFAPFEMLLAWTERGTGYTAKPACRLYPKGPRPSKDSLMRLPLYRRT